MTATVSIAKGSDPGYYSRQAAKGADYYSGAAAAGGFEPAGVWSGRGCPGIGLAAGSEVDAAVFNQLYSRFTLPGGRPLGRPPRKYRNGRDDFTEILDRLLEAEPHATAERRRELRVLAKSQVRQAVLYFDATFSPDKTITLLHASARAARLKAEDQGDDAAAAAAQAVEDAVWSAVMAGNAAMLAHLQDQAGYTRSGYHGSATGDSVPTGRWEDAHQWIVASWRQHTSRAGDPQLHVHNTILNRVRRERDGAWRTLDGRALYRERGAAAAIGANVMEAELQRTLGVRWRSRAALDGREVAGVAQALIDEFSSRTRREITPAVREMARAYQRQYGTEPDARALSSMQQRAYKLTRGAKEPSGDLSQFVRDWSQRARQADGEALEPVAAEAVHGPQEVAGQPALEERAAREVMAQGLARVQGKRSAWTRAELIRTLGDVLPARMETVTAQQAALLLPELADRVLAGEAGPVADLSAPELLETPASLRRADGDPVFRPHGAELYAAGIQLDLEARLISRAASRASVPALSRADAAVYLGADEAQLRAQLDHAAAADTATMTASGLRLDQAAAAYALMTGPARAQVLVGPAGTGKSRTVAVIARIWQEANPGARVVGLATSQQAAQVLRAEGLADSHNLKMFFTDGRLRAVIPPRSLFIVDEASMTSMSDLDRVLALAADAGAKVIVTGDHAQLGAVEQGGGLRLLSRKLGHVQLGQAMRFREDWQQDASLRLRAGDRSVLPDYDQHGRLWSGTHEQMIERAYRMWLADHLAGQHSALIARTEADAAELSRRAQIDLIRWGKVQRGDIRLRDGAAAGPGDLIMTRKNDHAKTVADGRDLANRDVFQVTGTDENGNILARLVTGVTGQDRALGPQFTLARRYAAEEAHLAYGITAHAAQGSTFDGNGYALVSPDDSRQYLYSAATRARGANHLFAVSDPEPAAEYGGPSPDPELARARILDAEHAGEDPDAGPRRQAGRDAISVLAACLDRDDTDLSATEALERALSSADDLGVLGSRWADLTRHEYQARYEAVLHQELPPALARSAADDPAVTWLYRSLRGAEYAGLDGAEVLRRAITARPMTGTRDPARVIDARVRRELAYVQPDPHATWSQRVPQAADPQIRDYLTGLARLMDARTERLGEHAATDPPPWALRHLGPVPADPAARADWAMRAGKVAAYREMWGYDHPADALGPAPDKRSPEARAGWHTALAALGIVDGQDLRELSDGELLLRARQYELATERAPQHAGDALRTMRMTAAEASEQAIRAAIERESAERTAAERDAQDRFLAERHRRAEESWRALAAKAEEEAAIAQRAQAVRDEYMRLHEPTLRAAEAAQAELARRHPDRDLAPQRNAEPVPLADPQPPPEPGGQHAEPVPEHEAEDIRRENLGLTRDHAAQPIPEHVTAAGRQAQAKAEELDQIRTTPLPPEREDEASPGDAWSKVAERERASVLQPPARIIDPAPETQRERQAQAGAEAG